MAERIELGQAFPLDWPAGYPRARTRARAPYKASVATARDQVLRELKLFGVPDWNVIISSNAPVSARTMQMLAIKAEPSDPGIAVYFRKNDQPYVFACDKWDRMADNLRAVALTIEAMRGLDRWGVSEMLARAFAGFKALPAPEPARERPWWEALSVARIADLEFIEDQYRRLVKKAHPDLGGNHEAMSQLNRAIAEARAEKGGV